jgi:hypothetical protein
MCLPLQSSGHVAAFSPISVSHTPSRHPTKKIKKGKFKNLKRNIPNGLTRSCDVKVIGIYGIWSIRSKNTETVRFFRQKKKKKEINRKRREREERR